MDMKGYYRKRGTKWSFTVDVGRDDQGKRKQKTMSGYKTKKEAEKACAELITQIEKGLYFEETRDTFGSFFSEWLENVAKPKVRDRTYAGYFSASSKRILPTFGHMKLTEIKPVHVLKFYNQLTEEGLSPEYIKYLQSMLKNTFSTALKWQLIQNNIMDHVDSPRIKRKEKQVWTIEQVNQFLEYAKTKKYHWYMVYLIAIYTGMRRGEILGLRWKDIDMDEGKLSINQTLGYVKGKGIVVQEPKTSRSHRLISISDYLIKELRASKLSQQKIRLQHGLPFSVDDFVVSHDDGSPVNPQYTYNHFIKTVKGVEGLPVIRFHDLRHTHATIMLKLGEHPKIVSERLGHSSIQMTLNLYSHVTYDMQKESSDRFEKALRKANE
jgi:integrase